MAIIAPNGFWDLSPTRKDDVDKENDVPVLTLTQFSKAPFVTFGTVKVGTSKSAVLQIDNPAEDVEAEVIVEKIASRKGFSVDHNTFTIQAEGSLSLTITWTPTEEGGVRELLVFNANGVVRHQAVLLGRAEAPKKKKKTLWDSIKNKPGSVKVPGQRVRRAEPTLKMAANKTFQVPRKAHYNRVKPRSPLASLNQDRSNRERPLSAESPGDKKRFLVSPVQDDHDNALKNSPLLRHLPEMPRTQRNSQDLLTLPENKDLTKLLNKTVSPIGTPDRLKKLMPCIETVEGPIAAAVISTESKTPALSVKDALALIGSDLSPISCSPQESSRELSDSLESPSGIFVTKTHCKSPEINEPRLTFFVGKNAALQQVKVFTSTTVTKSKAPVEANPSNVRQIKKSRRRLLERTLELTDSSAQSESRPGTPCLPVIEMDIQSQKANLQDAPSVRSSPPRTPVPITFLVTSPQPRDAQVASIHSSSPENPLPSAFSPVTPPKNPAPPAQEFLATRDTIPVAPNFLASSPESFPVHVPVKSKKRKSEEFLKADVEFREAEKSERLKRSKVVTAKCEPSKALHQRRPAVPRQQPKAAAVVAVHSKPSLKPASVKQKPHSSTKPSTRSVPSVKSSARKSKIIAVAQSKLTFIKPVQTAIPRHPMPFAAKNMFFDELWIEKQERGFTWWLNYVLTPDDFRVNAEVTKVNALSLAMGNEVRVPKAPTKEEMSFSTYTARRQLNRLRRSACQLFTSEPMVKAIQRLELEVEAKRLLIRKDRHLWKDIGERQKVLNWLLSFNPLWLRIGLETIYGELISLENNGDTFGLAMFILQRLLWNPDIAAEYRHPTVPHLYRDGHEEALSRFTLKKLLLLVCFLDKAKASRLIEHDPCLFCMDAEFKTSKDLLLAFSRDFLSGEGILPKHLGYLGLPVSHQQKPLDEFDFSVKNLAVDLKCGIRLVRVMELLVQDWSLSVKLRLPAISRLQKVHNVDLALQVLKKRGIDLKDDHGSAMDSKDIVDGHREKTLSLLWKIIFAFHVEVILNEGQLKEEIDFLRKAFVTKRRLAYLRTDRGPQPSPAKEVASFEHSSPRIQLLMEWVRAVCDFYSLKVENFTVSFSDGRALCYLIHHYHPSLVPSQAICQSTTQTVESSPRGRLQLDCSTSDSDCSFDLVPSGTNDSPFKELLENEKSNFRLVNSAVAFLGGVPAMINAADMSNTIPNEKVVMSYLSFLCTRLLDLRNETRAARVIQAAWRKYRLTKDLQLYQERNAAALKIQSLVRKFLQRRRIVRQGEAAVVIQAVWRGYVARTALRRQQEAQLRLLQAEAATVIQARWRMFRAMKSYQRLRFYTTVLQAQWRMRRAVSMYRRTLWAVSVIQSQTRAWSATKRERERFLFLRSAAVTIQRGYRLWKVRKIEKENVAAQVIQAAFRKWYDKKIYEKLAAAIKIQTWYRMQRRLHQYSNIRRSAVLIQAHYRGYVQRQSFQILKLQHDSATVIQSAFRGYLLRKRMAKMTLAAIVIQQHLRATLHKNSQRLEFLRTRSAAITLQAAYRGRLARGWLKNQHKAATVIQTVYRRYAAQKRYHITRKAAIFIQRRYKATCVAKKKRDEFLALRNATVKIQATWRGRVVRKRLEKQNRCATVMQAWFRRHVAQKRYKSAKSSAQVVQQYFRAYKAGKEARKAFLNMRAATVALQAAFRGMVVRKELKRKHEAATVLQSYVRMALQRKRYNLLQSAAIVVQCRYRALVVGRKQQREFIQTKEATLKIQAVYRGYLVRKGLKQQHKAAIAIQAHFRMYQIRMAYLATKCAAVILQERYRAKRLRDQQVQRFRSMKSATTTIQAAYRGYKTRKHIQEMQKAAVVIQRAFRSHRARNHFIILKSAAVVCQRWYRAQTVAKQQRKAYLSKRKAVIRLQATCRGHLVRKELREKHSAAKIIQSHFRKYQAQSRYKKLKWAVQILQERFSAQRQMKAEVHALKVKRNAAVVLQAAFRGMRARRLQKTRNEAAVVVQRAFKTYCQRKRYLALKLAAIIVQQRHRAYVATRNERARYLQLRKSAVVLQAVYRGHRVRKEVARWHLAATVVQSAFRKHREEVKYQAMRLSAIIIQRYYRSWQLKKQQRANFMKTRRSAIVIQAAFRGHEARKRIAKMHRAATVIQANFRRHRQQRIFKKQRWAACVLQKRFRAQRRMRLDVQCYQRQKLAAIVLQAAYRGTKARQIVRNMHQAAGVVQRAYKAYSQRKQYVALKASVLAVQRRYRATVEAKRQREQYDKMRKAAVTIQAAYRAHQIRKKVARWHQAAVVIQSAFRKHRHYVSYQAMRLSAIIIQRHYRSWLQQRQQRDRFLMLRHSAVVMQAIFRGRCVRKEIAKMHNAATVIQTSFRMHKHRTDFKRQRWAAGVFQKRFRAQKQMKQDVQRYQQHKKAAIVLQAAYRGMKSRQEVRQMHCAACVIQRLYRAHCEHKEYLALKHSALTIQRKYRATAAAKKQMGCYQQMRRAALVLQAVFRGHQVREEIRKRHKAAMAIQCAFRRHREESKYHATRLAAIIIQRRFRALMIQKQQRTKFLQSKRCAIVLQAAFRGYQVRKRLSKMHRAATAIQANFRRRKQQTVFRKQRWAACALQQRFRAQKQMKQDVQRYQQHKKAAIVLQAAYRGMKSRQEVRQMHCAACIIQRLYRAHCEHKEYLALKHSALTIQRKYRATAAAKKQMGCYQQMRRAAVVLQAVFRGYQVREEIRKRHKAAIVIQCAFRRHREESKYHATRLAAIIIQRHFRALMIQKQQRAKFLQSKRCAIVLQAAFRGYQVRKRLSKMHRAATAIQANFRRHKQQTVFRKQRWAACVLQQRFRAQKQTKAEMWQYQKQKEAVLVLQAAYQGMKVRRNVRRMHQAATVVQRAYKTYCQRKKYLAIKASVVAVQRRYRATVAAKKQSEQFEKMRRAAVTIQAVYRGQQVRKRVAHWHQAATVIQSTFRKHRYAVSYQAIRLSAIIIQRHYRSWLLLKQEQGRFLKVKQSTIVLQAAFRGWQVRRELARQNGAVIAIQSQWRGFVLRRQFLKKKEAVLKIQRWVRALHLGKRQRKDYDRLRHSAITLQRQWRIWITRRQEMEAAQANRRLRFTAAIFYHLQAIKIQRALKVHWTLVSAKKQINSVITIQRSVRTWLQKRRYQEDRRKVVVVQRAVRSWFNRRQKAACVLQRAARKFLLLRRQKRVQHGIIKAQALWRGHRSRRLNDNAKVVKLRQRLRKVTAGAREEDKLCNKTTTALDYLLRYKHFSDILEALKNLETATRLSPECCERLVESGATTTIFTLIRCCNRSIPCMEVITLSIQILLNLSKYHKTIEAVYRVERSVDTLLDLLQRYREKAGDKVPDKGGHIFTKACFLLALLLQDKHRVVEVMKIPKATEKLQSIYRLTARKHKMDAERTIVKQKMNASLNGSCFIQATPRKTRPIPKYAPDWVLKKDKLKDVVDPLRAIYMVAEKMSIVM